VPPVVGVPERTPAGLKVMLDGNVDGVQPLYPFKNVGAGNPVAVAWKLPAEPTVNMVELALVTAGTWVTVRVKF